MMRWFVVLVLLLTGLPTGDAAAVERFSVVTDNGFELRVPFDERKLRVSEAAPSILEGMQNLMGGENIRILEMLMTREDIELTIKEENPKDLVFRINRHPVSGTAFVEKAVWEDLRPRYRRTVETVLTAEGQPQIQEKVDELFNDKLEEDAKVRLNRIGQVVTYREDETSLRVFAFVEIKQGGGEEARSSVVRGFTSTVFIGNRLFLVQATRNIDGPDHDAGFREDQVDFDRFVDHLIDLNSDNGAAK